MKKTSIKFFIASSFLFVLFVVFTVLIKTVNTEAIGPNNSVVGFAALNQAVFEGLGQNSIWDVISDAFMIAALLIAACFAVIGFVQILKRKKLLLVDKEILALGILYVLIATFFVIFEFAAINFRPILQDGLLEASYPSTHALIVGCVFGSVMILADYITKNKYLKIGTYAFSSVVIALTIVARLLSGMHWLTDVVAAVILTSALLVLFAGLKFYFCKKENN